MRTHQKPDGGAAKLPKRLDTPRPKPALDSDVNKEPEPQPSVPEPTKEIKPLEKSKETGPINSTSN